MGLILVVGVPLGAQCSPKVSLGDNPMSLGLTERLAPDVECAGVSESPGIQGTDPVCPRPPCTWSLPVCNSPCCRVSQCWCLTGVY